MRSDRSHFCEEGLPPISIGFRFPEVKLSLDNALAEQPSLGGQSQSSPIPYSASTESNPAHVARLRVRDPRKPQDDGLYPAFRKFGHVLEVSNKIQEHFCDDKHRFSGISDATTSALWSNGTIWVMLIILYGNPVMSIGPI
ncbi:hypothetical protein CRG98_025919 [Punica granatum]|uniref:Uncharacterized protein n=1 Tax=Punica granatum TaxID=22663 RepID=A0A2I0JBQ5_PUNGR|nr:hypothetical protein CRG98_025919 [Punica granatum]